VRDDRSYATCLQLGRPRERVKRVPDAVFANPPAAFGVQPRAARPDRGPLRVALNLNYDIENRANWETFLANLADALHAFHARSPLEVHALPMQSRFKAENDWKVLAEFQARVPDIPMQLHRPEDHCDAAALIASCDMVMSERLHGLVMAAILGIPSFALMYDVKVQELVATLGIEAYSVDINQPFDPQDVAGRLGGLCANAVQAAAHLQARSVALRQELDGYFSELDRLLA
jgi:polysaccharide pyruvyl transferase WcaK-like protein